MTRIGLIVMTVLGALVFGAIASLPTQPGAASEQEAAGTFEIDPVHSSVVFRISHLGVSPFYGRFNDFDGSFTLADGGQVEVVVDAGSVDTKNEARNNHLRSPDFFNAKQYPTITFTSTSMKQTGENTYEVAGELTLVGRTHPVMVVLTKTGEKDGGARSGYRAGLAAELTIKRSDYGMTYGIDNGALGDEVTLLIGLEGVKQ